MFGAFAQGGKALRDLHIGYETVDPYPLKYVETSAVAAVSPPPLRAGRDSNARDKSPVGTPALQHKPLSYRVEDKMRLAKDRQSLRVNDTLTLAGIPAEAFENRLGNRAALGRLNFPRQEAASIRAGARARLAESYAFETVSNALASR